MKKLTNQEIERRKSLVLECKTLCEFKKKYEAYELWFRRNMPEVLLPLEHVKKKNGTFKHASNEELINMAKQFEGKTRTEVRNSCCALANELSKRNLWGLCDNIVLPKNYITDPIHYVYVYEYPQNKVAYVGRTHEGEAGDLREKKHSNDENDSVCKYAIENNIKVPSIKILEDGLTAEESRQGEINWMQKYRDLGWTLLNKAPGGSLGGLKHSDYTEEDYYNAVIKYNYTMAKEMPKLYQIGRTKNRNWYKKYKHLFINPRNIPVRAICPDGSIVDFDSIFDACQKLNLKSESSVKDVLFNKYKRYKGYSFMYPT